MPTICQVLFCYSRHQGDSSKEHRNSSSVKEPEDTSLLYERIFSQDPQCLLWQFGFHQNPKKFMRCIYVCHNPNCGPNPDLSLKSTLSLGKLGLKPLILELYCLGSGSDPAPLWSLTLDKLLNLLRLGYLICKME